jgi:hypothetical protein
MLVKIASLKCVFYSSTFCFVFFKSLFSSEYAQCNVCRRVIGLFIQQRNLWCVWFMIRARRLNLEETAISSTCVCLIARPVVQHTCIITPKIINIRNDYKMSRLLSNATFIDKPVYHSGCIFKYLTDCFTFTSANKIL